MRRNFIFGMIGALGLLIAMWPTARATVSCSVPFTFQNNTTADATQVNSNFNAIIACLANAASAGANTDITSIGGLTTPLSGAQGGTSVFIGGTSGGSANAQTVATTVPNSFTLTAGNRVTFIAGFTNTNATTLQVGATSATNLFRPTTSGAVAMAGGELVAGNPYTAVYNGSQFVLDTRAVTIGEIVHFGGSSAPAGIVLADGSAISRTQYAALFAVIGTTYGAGDTVTTFNVPDLRGRAAYMADSAGRITGACPAAGSLGVGCGSQSTTLAQANLPNVNFTVSGTASGTTGNNNSSLDHTHNFTAAVAGGGAVGGGAATLVVQVNTTAGANSSLDHTHNASLGVTGTAASGGSGSAFATLSPGQIVNAGIRY